MVLDARGAVRAVTNQAGTVVRQHDYFPFGEQYAGSGNGNGDAHRFTGKERDAESGLDYFGARYYPANLGRFTTVDPWHVGGDVGNPQTWNAYAGNNPLRNIDPDGRRWSAKHGNAVRVDPNTGGIEIEMTTELATITIDVSYAQIAVFGSTVESPFNHWTEKHVAQGFAWRPGSVSFRTLEESGPHTLTVVVSEHVGPVRADAVRAIDVPFDVPFGETVEIASITDSAQVAVDRPGFFGPLVVGGRRSHC